MRPDAMPQVVQSAAGRGHLLECAVRFLERVLRFGERPSCRLRLCESLALGERRFVAVVEFEKRRFLLGGTGQSLVLLARLDEPPLDKSSEPAARPTAEELD